jgi:hypothetical protein
MAIVLVVMRTRLLRVSMGATVVSSLLHSVASSNIWPASTSFSCLGSLRPAFCSFTQATTTDMKYRSSVEVSGLSARFFSDRALLLLQEYGVESINSTSCALPPSEAGCILESQPREVKQISR